MKKLYPYIFLVLLILIAFLAISILFNNWFDANGDYLSAFATILATLVAMNFFKDWRDRYNSRFFEKLKDKFAELYSVLEFRLEFYFQELKNNENINNSKIRFREARISFNELSNEIDYYEKILNEFQDDKKNLRENLEKVKKSLNDVNKILNYKSERSKNYNYVVNIGLDEILLELENDKTILIRDINSIILTYLKK